MKRVLSLVLVLMLVLGAIMPAFAETAGTVSTETQQLADLGVIAGDGNGYNEMGTLTRAEFAVILSQLYGMKASAAAYELPASFTDLAENAWYIPYVAYAESKGWMTGDAMGGTFRPDEAMSAQEVNAMYLKVLGYTVAWDEVNAKATEVGVAVTASNTGAVLRGEAFKALRMTLDQTPVGEAAALGTTLPLNNYVAPAVVTGDVEVSSVEVASATSFEVMFANAVDTEEVTFEISRLTTPLTVTTTWNEAKTVATLTSAAKLAEATFTVKVMAGEVEVSNSGVTVFGQKVDRIEFTSDSVAVNLTSGDGFITYKVFDQYDVDITSNYLANNMTFQSGAGTVTAKDGLISIVPGATPLIQFQQISVIVFDTTSGVSSTVTLPTANAIGTLKSFTLGSTEGLELNDGDITSVFYLPYTATDMSGNVTTNYDLIMGGLIFSGTNDLHSSLPSNVSASIVRDPADSKAAAIEIKVLNGTAVSMDMPITITAMTYSGTTSSISTTLVKAKKIYSLSLLAPSETVATTETPEIVFEAYDQFGNKVTKYNEIVPYITMTGLTAEKNVDGTLKLKMIQEPAKTTKTISVVVANSGKMSTLTINIQDSVIPTRIDASGSGLVLAMEHGAIQEDVGLDNGDVVIYDQYDREYDADDLAADGYRVDISSNGSIDINTAGNNAATHNAYADDVLIADAIGGGNDTVVYSLVKVAGNVIISTDSISFAVIKTTDIIDYTINTFADPIFETYNGTNTNAQEVHYDADVKVYGKTNSGAEVMLAGTPVVSATVENSTDFVINNTATTSYGALDINVSALDVTDDATTASTVVSVNLFHNGQVTSLTTNVTSSEATPTAKSIAVKGADSDKKETIKLTDFNNMDTLNQYIVQWDQAGTDAAVGASATKATVYFRAYDAVYGKYGVLPAQFIIDVQDANGAAGTSVFTVNALGKITATTGVVGDKIFITAITDNGLLETVELEVVAD